MFTAAPPKLDAMYRLQSAIDRGDARAFETFIEELTPFSTDYGAKALRVAIFGGHAWAIELLLRAGADPNATDAYLKSSADPKTAIWLAVEQGHARPMELLIAAGARLDLTDRDGSNLLHRAAEAGFVDACRCLIRAGIPINSRDNAGNTVMHYAVGRGNIELFDTLLDHGAEVDARNSAGMTPALIAAQRQRSITFAVLVAYGCDPGARDEEGNSAFDLALSSPLRAERDDLALQLLQSYPCTAPTGARLDCAFVESVRRGHAGLVQKLAELGADLGQRPGGRTLLQIAPAKNEQLKRVLRALKSEAAIASAMDDGSDPAVSNPSTPTL